MAKRIKKKRKQQEEERIAREKKEREDALRFKENYLDERVSRQQQERKQKRQEELEIRQAKQRTPEEIAAAKRHVRVILFAILGAIIALALVARSAVLVLNLEVEKKEAEKKLEQATKERDQLKEELDNVYSAEYVEQEARSELRMIYPGETIYILEDSSEEEAPQEDSLKAKPDEGSTED